MKLLQILLVLQLVIDPELSHNVLMAYWFVQNGEYDSAATIFKKYGLFEELAELYILEGEYDSAVAVLKTTIQKKGETARILRIMTKAYVYKGDKKHAIKMAKRMASLFPDSTEALKLAARVFFEFDEYELAKKTYRKLIQLGASSDSIWLEMANTFLLNDELDSAIKYYRKALISTLQPNIAFYGLGLCFEQLGQKDSALFYYSEYKKLLEYQGQDDPMVDKRLARLWMEVGDYEKSLEILVKLKELFPTDFDIRLWLAYNYNRLENYKDALNEALAAMGLNPNEPEAHFLAAEAAFNLGNFIAAIRFAKNAAKLGKDEVKYPLYLASIELRLGRAREALKTAKKIKKKNDSVYWIMGLSAWQIGDTSNALKYMGKSLSLNQEHVERFVEYANFLKEAGRLEEADSVISFALSLFPENLDLWITYAMLHYDDDFEAADSAFARAYKLNPDDPLLLNNWGYLLAEHGVRLTEAKEMLERALEAEPENPYYLDSMGWIYYKMGDYRTALAYLLHAFQVKSDDPDICEHLGFTFRMLGDIKRATEFWKKALELDPSRKHLIKLLKQFEANL